MLFNSLEFILGFLPITLAVFYFARRFLGTRLALVWLTVASLFFYGWWNPAFLLLLVGSIGFNYVFGLWLSRPGSTRLHLALGITANLGLIGYFKYAGFFVGIFGAGQDNAPTVEAIVLPLAISFFTFQQIGYLIEARRGQFGERSLVRYFAFVSFFPQLIAGPIVLHGEMFSQFCSDRVGILTARNLAVGGTIFILGLGKKVILADSLAGIADPIFDGAAGNAPLVLIEAWVGALAYTLQIYFDFSGYSDMAIGIAYMFGFRFPINFASPYKAVSIIEFWRRWHITLSRFLRVYLYIPLGGNRKGDGRRYANLVATMLLGGLWHGAGWTFVAWGGLHGLFLVINHLWIEVRVRHPKVFPLPLFTSHALTLLVVVVAWVFFRSDDLGTAFRILAAMIGLNGSGLPDGWPYSISLVVLTGVVALTLPDNQQVMGRFSPATGRRRLYRGWLARQLLWRPNLRWATGISLMFSVVLIIIAVYDYIGVEPLEYIYFQF
jgi:D-alanyl-lipoteichoic acid acyltransferase DltB (MBOAT superfamily)